MRRIAFSLPILLCLIVMSCQKSRVPVVTEWIGLQTKETIPLEKEFRTAGTGVGAVSWWAGGYTWSGGYFIIELVDVKNGETVVRKLYRYGDTETGNNELPKFKWWHSEEKGRIILAANRVYKMKLRAGGLAQPGAGWGLWLYKIGEEEPRRRGGKIEQ